MIIKHFIVIILVILNFSLGDENENAQSETFRRRAEPSDSDRWALVVSGSKGWRNYGDQANLCHAYKVLVGHGIRKTNIITMMYDDIANHPKNPRRWFLKNEPDGGNVYEGVDIDYKSTDVTAEIFLRVLKGEKLGDEIGSSRVIESAPNNRIFVYFTGQGVPGALLFPQTILYAAELNQALKDMHKNRSFHKMILYIDAPYSGSLFEDFLPRNQQIMAVTAATPWQTAYKCYKDKRLSVSLGSYFSVNWMHDTEARKGLDKAYFKHQINWISRHTTTSTITKYGDLRLVESHLSEFMGTRWTGKKKFQACKDQLDGVNIMMKILRLMGDNDLMKYYLRKDHQLSRSNVKCYESCVRHFSSKCMNIAEHPYLGEYLHVFINICSSDKITLNQIRDVMDEVCVKD